MEDTEPAASHINKTWREQDVTGHPKSTPEPGPRNGNTRETRQSRGRDEAAPNHRATTPHTQTVEDQEAGREGQANGRKPRGRRKGRQRSPGRGDAQSGSPQQAAVGHEERTGNGGRPHQARQPRRGQDPGGTAPPAEQPPPTRQPAATVGKEDGAGTSGQATRPRRAWGGEPRHEATSTAPTAWTGGGTRHGSHEGYGQAAAQGERRRGEDHSTASRRNHNRQRGMRKTSTVTSALTGNGTRHGRCGVQGQVAYQREERPPGVRTTAPRGKARRGGVRRGKAQHSPTRDDPRQGTTPPGEDQPGPRPSPLQNRSREGGAGTLVNGKQNTDHEKAGGGIAPGRGEEPAAGEEDLADGQPAEEAPEREEPGKAPDGAPPPGRPKAARPGTSP